MSRILYVCHRVPYPPDKGDRIRNYHLLRQLAKQGEVSLACLDDESASPAIHAELQKYASQIAIVPTSGLARKARMATSVLAGRSLSEGNFWQPRLAKTIQDWHSRSPFNVAICSASSVAAYLRQGPLKNVPGFVDIVDCDSRKWFDFAESMSGPKRWLYQFEGRRVQKLEREIAGWAAACTLVSDAESKIFNDACRPLIAKSGSKAPNDFANTATTATNGVDLDYFQPRETPEELTCTFVGAMDYLPNVDAVIWFADVVWPNVREKFPKAEFCIVGRKPTEAIQALGKRPGIRVTGTVSDVRDEVAKSAVIVVPMRLSRGLQNKVLESLAMAKATIVSPPALAALKTMHDRDVIQAESVGDWVTSICQLFNDDDRRRVLGRNGRRYVEYHHDWATCLAPLMDLIREASETTKPQNQFAGATA